jgi:predicted ATPase
LVGREEEIALLLRRWQQAKEGEGQVVLVGGEPGIGKSRLARVLRERLANEGHTVLRYQCSPYHVNSALYPAIEQLERAAGFTREDSVEQKLNKMEGVLAGDKHVVAAAAPLFAALLSLPMERYPALNLSPRKQKEKTLDALAGQVEALANRQPVLMIYEDVHWVDATTQEELDLLVPRLRDLPVFMVVTYRPEYSPRWTDQAHVSTLGLNRLGRRQGAELVERVTGGKPLPRDVLEQVLSHTDGVPLFIEELTKSVLESKLMRETDAGYVLDTPLPALAIPTTLRDSLIARLDRLAPVRELAQIGSCVGRQFSHQLLALLSPLKGEAFEDAIELLAKTGLVFRRGTPPDATYTFKHALVQDAAHDSLLKSKRAQLHAQIAQVLERDFADTVANEPEILAHHYTEAGNLTRAIPLWRSSGEMALARVALQEAVGHFQKALALIERLPRSAERDELELSIREPLNGAWTAWRGWPAPEVTANAAAILALAKGQGTPRSLLIGLYGMWISTLCQGRVAESLDWAHRVLAEGNKARDIDLQVLGHSNVMASDFFLGQLLEAREQGERVLALYDPQRAGRWMQLTGRDARTAVGVYSPHWIWMLGYPDQAVQASDEKDAHARRLGHAFNLGWALTTGTHVFDYRREPERLLERLREADRLAREQSLPIIYDVTLPMEEGLARLRRGELVEASALMRRGLERWIGLGGHLFNPYTKSALAEALALQGDLDAALQLIDEALLEIERPGRQQRVHLAEVLRLKGWILLRQGKGEDAEAQLRASINIAREQQARSWELRTSTSLAELWKGQGKHREAHELLAPIYNWFTEGFETKDLKDAKVLLESLS